MAFSEAYKGLVVFDNACSKFNSICGGSLIKRGIFSDYCPLPWPMANGLWRSISGNGWRNCDNKEKPCDFCSCEAVEGQKAKLHIEADGCKKPKRCGPVCPHDKTTRRVGDVWACWISDYK